MAAVTVEQLTKSYGAVHAVTDVSFEVHERGEVFALLGPNGAGKTTAIEILEGFRARDAGRVDVLGFDPAGPPARLPRAPRHRAPGARRRAVALGSRGAQAQCRVLPPAPPVDEVIELVGLPRPRPTTG